MLNVSSLINRRLSKIRTMEFPVSEACCNIYLAEQPKVSCIHFLSHSAHHRKCLKKMAKTIYIFKSYRHRITN